MFMDAEQTKTTFLDAISAQYVALLGRVANDVAKYRAGEGQVSPVGFIIYDLTDPQGTALKDRQLQAHALELEHLKETEGFGRLTEYCAKLGLNLRLDAHYLSGEREPTKVYRMIVDGWS